MGGVLDRIRKVPLIKSSEIVTDGFVTREADVDFLEGSFSIQFSYEGLSGTLTSIIEVSVDGINFAEVADTDQVFTDASGSHIYDLSSTGVTLIRVKFTGGGSMILNDAILVGSRRH